MRTNTARRGFTIVELLVVIVVIGILAAITIISYTGIVNRATQASLQSDLSNASVQLKLFLGENNVYPGSISDCPSPQPTNLCLKASTGNTYSSYSVNNTTNPPTYSLSMVNGSNIYEISSTNQNPTALTSAPLNPVADWLATTTGDHYGNFYDLVTHSYATVTRSTPKTIYDPNTQHIYDVPANTLGIRPRSDGKSGSEAEIEEGRTNYLLNSYFNNGLTNWSNWGSPPTREVVAAGGVYSSNVVHIITNGNNQGIDQSVSTNIGTMYTATAFVKVVSGQPTFMANNNGAYPSGSISANWAGDGLWHKVSFSFTESTTTDYVYFGKSAVGAVGEYYLSNIQLEAGSFATSYIPTTTMTVTRNADVIKVPTTNWNKDIWTSFAVTGGLVSTSSFGSPLDWASDNNNHAMQLYESGTTAYATVKTTSAWSGTKARSAGYLVHTGRFSNGNPVSVFLNGVKGTDSANASSNASAPNLAIIGGTQQGGVAYYNSSIQRVVVYSSALSDSDVATATSSIQNGP